MKIMLVFFMRKIFEKNIVLNNRKILCSIDFFLFLVYKKSVNFVEKIGYL